jgi:hypothetical protein
MIIARQRARGLQAPAGRHVAPLELAGIGGAGAINMMLLWSHRSSLRTWSRREGSLSASKGEGETGARDRYMVREQVQTKQRTSCENLK